jgi:hypothetical protein
MVTVKVTRKGNRVFLEGSSQPLPLTKELKEIFSVGDVVWFEATVNRGVVTLLRTVPAP